MSVTLRLWTRGEIRMAELVVICEGGFEVRGVQDDVVARTQEHGREAHNMDVTREQVLAMAKPATESD